MPETCTNDRRFLQGLDLKWLDCKLVVIEQRCPLNSPVALAKLAACSSQSWESSILERRSAQKMLMLNVAHGRSKIKPAWGYEASLAGQSSWEAMTGHITKPQGSEPRAPSQGYFRAQRFVSKIHNEGMTQNGSARRLSLTCCAKLFGIDACCASLRGFLQTMPVIGAKRYLICSGFGNSNAASRSPWCYKAPV